VHGEQVIGTAVPASPGAGNGKRMRQVTKGPISAGRIGRSLRVLTGPAGKRRRKSQSSLARRGSRPPRGEGERSGTQEWLTQEGPQNTGRFWLRGTSVPDAGPERSKDQRTLGPRSLVDRSGSSQEGVVRWKATPELVSQDRERVGRAKASINQVTNTGISFARRSGGWQQCRPPFLLWQGRAGRPMPSDRVK
jgi:hypothetical protein